MTGSLRSRDTGYTLLAMALPLLLLLPALIQPSRLIYPSWSTFSDLTLIHWPKVALIRGSLAQGFGYPLWSPYGLSGQPLAANQLAMLFYPPALLLLAGPLAWSFSLFFAVHLAWASAGTYWLVRGLGRQPESALLAAVIFALSGKLAAHLAIGHASLVAALAWAPWAFAFLQLALSRRSTPFAALTGVALAAQLTTHTYALVYTAYGLILYSLLYLVLSPGTVADRLRAGLHLVPRLALVPLLAVLLGSAQLLPLLEMAPHSNRALTLAEATLFSLSPAQTLTGILFPTPNVGHEWIIYPGLLTLGLAAGAWYARKERPVIIFALLSALGVILALGDYTPLYRLAYEFVPGLHWMRTPARLWFFVSLGLAILAAYGFEAWQMVWRRPNRRLIRLILVAAIGFSVVLSLAVTFGVGQTSRGAWGLALFGALSGALLLWATVRRPGPLFLWLALLLIAADLLTFGYSLLRLEPEAAVAAQGRDAAQWLAVQTRPFRVYSPSYSLPQTAASDAALEQIDGVEPVHLTDYDRFMALAGGYGEGPFSVTIPPFPDEVSLEQAHRDAQPNLQLLGQLNGQYLAAAFPLNQAGLTLQWQDQGTWLYENEFALPRVLVVHQIEPVTNDQAWERISSIDPARIALVESDKHLSGATEPSSARIITKTPNHLVVEAELDAAGLLVLSEIWYPGWQARDNGQQIPILRTNAILRGVYLDAGHHTVEFRYEPWTVRVGWLLSGATTLILAAVLVIGLTTWGLRRKHP
jgi:hypothetical protein